MVMPHDFPNFKNEGFGNFKPHQPPHGVEWMREHPYAFLTYGIIIALLIGVVFFIRRDTAPQTHITAWSGVPATPDAGDYNPPAPPPPPPATTTPTILEDLSRNDKPFDIPYAAPEAPLAPSTGFDLNEFIQRLRPNTSSAGTSTDSTSAIDLIKEAYSYIPSGLINTVSAPTMTTLQKEIFNYGNEIGARILSFEDRYPNAIAILKDQATDRGNAQKAAALTLYAEGMSGVGYQMLALNDVPKEVAPSNQSLAKSYIKIGENLALVAKSISEADFLHAIEVYNKSVEAHTNEFVAMATLFGAYDVHFGNADSGRVFTFTQATF